MPTVKVCRITEKYTRLGTRVVRNTPNGKRVCHRLIAPGQVHLLWFGPLFVMWHR